MCCGQTSQRVYDGCREESADAGGGKPHSQKCSYSMQPENIHEALDKTLSDNQCKLWHSWGMNFKGTSVFIILHMLRTTRPTIWISVIVSAPYSSFSAMNRFSFASPVIMTSNTTFEKWDKKK